MDDLLSEVSFSANKGRPAKAPPIVVVRPLTPEDLPFLTDPDLLPVPQALPTRKSLRYSHHRAAQLLAQGQTRYEVSLVTGYTPDYITSLQSDPAFKGLLAYYAGEREKIFLDTVERMRQVGITALEELQTRLEEEPEKWSRQDLMLMTKLLLTDPMKVGANGGAGGPSGPAVDITVNFVSPKAEQGGPIIDGVVEKCD
jgi:hypothetical protein